jgi:hypothetical protein
VGVQLVCLPRATAHLLEECGDRLGLFRNPQVSSATTLPEPSQIGCTAASRSSRGRPEASL